MKNEIKNLKASLEVMRDYAKEAENLISQINKETENIKKDYDHTLQQIKDMIHEDMHELKKFSNSKYPDTTCIKVHLGKDKNNLPIWEYTLLFENSSPNENYKMAIKQYIRWEDRPSPDVLYADGAFAGEAGHAKLDPELQKAVAQKERIYQRYCCLKAVCDSADAAN